MMKKIINKRNQLNIFHILSNNILIVDVTTINLPTVASFCVSPSKATSVAGFGRLICDEGLYFYIQDLIVHPDYQNQGFGKTLMKELMNYISTNAKTGAFIGLMAAKGLEKYYEFFGFKARDAHAPGMYQVPHQLEQHLYLLKYEYHRLLRIFLIVGGRKRSQDLPSTRYSKGNGKMKSINDIP
jgi:GNAT superfamily N-acetyltransferase